MSEEFEKFKKAVKVIVNTPKEKKRKPKKKPVKKPKRKGVIRLVRHIYRSLLEGDHVDAAAVTLRLALEKGKLS